MSHRRYDSPELLPPDEWRRLDADPAAPAAEVEPFEPVLLARTRRDQDDRDLRGRAQPPADLEAVDLGQRHVEEFFTVPSLDEKMRYAARRMARTSIPMNVYLWEDEMPEVLPSIPDPSYERVRAIEFHTRTTSKYYGDDCAVR
ncbi:MAG TPA: hypothetical protein VNI57_02890 [Candidatus Saccharimonadales bacterium]|nr:hypothetical protein [Candidatus Saccharimonadales bacterium]